MFESADDYNREDYALLQNSAVNLFWDPAVLVQSREALARLDYDEADISCLAGWSGIREPFSIVLRWQDQFGYAPWTGNLDALNDGLGGYPFGPSRRAMLVLRGFHCLVEENRSASEALLDMLEHHARNYLLWGKTLIVLVQTDDNDFESPSIGARYAGWNSRERLDSERGL